MRAEPGPGGAPGPRFVVVALVACAALHVALSAVLFDWFVEDAAISMSYARNLASGQGLVPFAGGERVEGYSNFLWVLLLASFAHFGVDGFAAARAVGLFASLLTLPLVWVVARRAYGDDRWVPALATLLLGANAQFVIWNASGLENGLFNLLLALSVALSLSDGARRRWLAPGAFLMLSLTRPEGIAYAAVALALHAWWSLRDGGLRRGLWGWLLLWALPLAAYHAWRIDYFAWPLPNTYYAKLGDAGGEGPLRGLARGFAYLLGYAGPWSDARKGPGLWLLLLSPVYLLSLRHGGEQRRARALCWAMAGVALAFAVWARGDWMPGYRWLSMASVPLSVLFAVGAGELARRVPTRAGAVYAGLTLLALAPHGLHLHWFVHHRPTTPMAVKRRIEHRARIERTLDLDRATVVDVDMGAHTYWSRDRLVDLAGLIDVPMAHWGRNADFQREYFFRERRPELVHLHGNWARRIALDHHPEWSRQYVELPPYTSHRGRAHAGDYLRRDLLFSRRWEGEAGRSAALGGLALHGWSLPGLPTAAGLQLRLELGLGLARGDPPAAPVGSEVVLRLERQGATVSRWAVQAGYGWVPPSRWRSAEVFHGVYSLPLPATLAPGRYDLRVGHDGATASFEGVVTVVTPAEARDRSTRQVSRMSDAAQDGDCDGAEALWRGVRARHAGQGDVLEGYRRAARGVLARCLLERADAARGADRVALLSRARRLAPGAARVRAGAGELAHERYAQGEAARLTARALAAAAQRECGTRPPDDAGVSPWLAHNGTAARRLLEACGGDRFDARQAVSLELSGWQYAYDCFRDALALEPTLAWARRRAEEARAQRLGLLPGSARLRERALEAP